MNALLDAIKHYIVGPYIDRAALIDLFRLEQENDIKYLHDELDILTDLEAMRGQNGLVRSIQRPVNRTNE